MHTNPTALWAGKILLLAGAVMLGLSSSSHAQCCTPGSMGIEYGMPMMEAVDPAAELLIPDDPTQMINLTIVVPEKAIVKINDEPTFTTGTVRPYVVRGLQAGKKYKFVIVATYVNEFGAVYEAKKEVTLDAGSSDRVAMPLRRVKRPEPPKEPAPVVPGPTV